MNIENIDISNALRYMGYRNLNDIPEETLSYIKECENELVKKIMFRYLYKPFKILKISSGIKLENTDIVLQGKSISEHLNGCHSAILICATISAGADRVICQAKTKDIETSIIYDSLATAAIEQEIDKLENIIKNEYPLKYLTWRFSPGYGDLPIELQKEIIREMNANKKIGLYVNEYNVLIPTKSVTAIIGISDNEIERNRRGCVSCNLYETCRLRKDGNHCGT